MKWRNRFGMCLLLGLSIFAFGLAESVIAGEPLPDASLLAANRPPQPKPPPQPKVSDVNLTGVIDAVQFNGLTIKAGNGKGQKQWLVLAKSDATAFTVRGTATLDYLHDGQTIEFNGKSEKVGGKANEEKVGGKVDELTIVSRKGAVPRPKKGDAKDHEAAALDERPNEKILARIASHDEKSLTLTVGQRTIHVDLADTPTINVDLALFHSKPVLDAKDASKSRIEGKAANGMMFKLPTDNLVGSKIVARGTGVESQAGNQCAANSIEITLAKPLTGNKAARPPAKKPALAGK